MKSRTGNGIAIMGATSTGKSELAIRLAEAFNGEIVSMDSRQVYRRLDVGTAKVTETDRSRAPHHLIDELEPDEINSAGKHVTRARALSDEIEARGRLPLLVGGTGMYFRVLFEGMIDLDTPDGSLEATRRDLEARETADLRAALFEVDPERAGSLSANDRVRIMRALEIFLSTGKTHTRHIAEQSRQTPWVGLRVVLSAPRARLRQRIAERTNEMFQNGWGQEVASLLESGVSPDAPAMRSLGYGEIAAAILRGDDPADALPQVVTLTQQYAKRQETFFRSVKDARWFDVTEPDLVGRVSRLVADSTAL